MSTLWTCHWISF